MIQGEFWLLAGVDAPLLADVQITFRHDFSESDRSQVLSSNLFRTRDRQTVFIASQNVAAFVPSAPFVWDHLTDLTLKHMDTSWTWGVLDCGVAYQLLKGCPRLRSLICPIRCSGLEQTNEDLLLPSLESLTMNNYSNSSEVLEKLVDQLIMPQLSKFYMINFHPSASLHMSGFVSLERLADRSPLISDLSLELSDITTSSLVSVLQRLPCLETVGLIIGDFTEQPTAADLTRTLTPDADALHLCPALRHFTLECRGFADDIWVNFLQMNLDYNTSLRRVYFHFWSPPPETVPDVEPFLARGLDVTVKYIPVDERAEPTPWQGIEALAALD
ncbi:hypothetical protein MVEN_00364600 [Mycena venus]|uniref:F-box domain-containing protein n=1 Tax=Mycena venus TaxID=2733690 RepID=A0A8H6YW57_9AGAR|nr:hypothetical protein MVEN_00364600 [Mycena venus]